jgi:hypothetical protein
VRVRVRLRVCLRLRVRVRALYNLASGGFLNTQPGLTDFSTVCRQAMRREAGAIGAEVEAVTAQLDFLQQRMQKQELISPKYERLRRRAGRLIEDARTVDREIEQVKEQGMLSGLDPSIADDLTEVNASVGGAALPSGTREALFHRIYFPHVVSPSAGNGAGGSSSFSPPNGGSAQQHRANGNHGSNGNGPSS